MKKYVIAILIITGFFNLSSAEEIDISTARSVAQSFYYTQIDPFKTRNLEFTLVYQSNSRCSSDLRSKNVKEVPLFYVFNAGDDDGFVIIAGDDVAAPVLGYSDIGKYNTDSQPQNFKKWIEEYKNQIRYAIVNNFKANKDIKEQWSNLLSGLPVRSYSADKGVDPMIQTTWDQSPYYNALCPYDNYYIHIIMQIMVRFQQILEVQYTSGAQCPIMSLPKTMQLQHLCIIVV